MINNKCINQKISTKYAVTPSAAGVTAYDMGYSLLPWFIHLHAAAMGVASFPLDKEGPSFATGALKVNPA